MAETNRVDLEALTRTWEGLSNKVIAEKEEVVASLNLALDAAQLGQWDLDLVHDRARHSLRHDQIFGHATKQADWSWQDFTQHVIPEDRQAVTEQFWKAAKLGGTFYFEFRTLWADQSVHWIAARGQAFLDEQGVPVRMAGVVMDITERKQTDERFRILVESSPNAWVMVDQMGKIVLVNVRTEAMFGYARDEMLGQPVEMLLPERFRAGHRRFREGYLANPMLRRMGVGRELYGLRHDGTEFPVEIGLSPVRTDQGLFVLSALVDMTERIRMEETMRQNRALLEAIHHAQVQFILAEDPLAFFAEFLKSLLTLSNSEYGFIDEMFYDAEGKPILTARAITDISWSEESRKMYQQFLNGTLNFTNLRSLYGVVMESAKPVIANDAPHDPRRTGTPPGHPPLKAFLGLPLISSAKEFVGVIGLANRPGGYHQELITYLAPMVSACANLIAARKNDQRRRLAEQESKRYAAELERSNRELDQFAYAASHDLRAPMRAVDNLAQWITEDAGPLLPEASQRDLAMLRQRIERMQRLLDDMLAYSRAGRVQHKIEEVNCQELVRDLVKMLGPPGRMTVSIGALPVLTTERTPLEQVFLNLIGNAIKHHHRDDGRIEVAARELANQVEFVVRDDGPGIAAEFHQQVFEMFQTLRPRDEVEGSGMGLALVKKVVENRGGKVTLESSPGNGAAFSFTWPKSTSSSSATDVIH